MKMTASQIVRLSFWIVLFYQSRQRVPVNQPTKSQSDHRLGGLESNTYFFTLYLVFTTANVD